MKVYLFIVLVGVLDAAPAGSAQDEFAPPKPTKYHDFLKQFVGTWDVQAKIWTEPGKPPILSSAIETASLKCQGLWLIYNDKGELGGRPFEGYGMLGFDEDKGKYVGSWVDQTSTVLDIAAGTCDEKGKVFNMISDSVDAAGKTTRTRRVIEIRGPDAQSQTSYQGPEGKEVKIATFEFTRRK